MFCGAYPFTQDANGFLCSYNDLEDDDMVYVEVEIVNERLCNKISRICDKRYNEIQKLKTKQSDKYSDKWYEYRKENGPNYSEIDKRFFSDEDNNLFACLTENYCFSDKYTHEAVDDINKELEEEFDKKWMEKYGDLSAKEYWDEYEKTCEYVYKVMYANYRDEIEFYNQSGCDLYLYYEPEFNDYAGNQSAILRGFMPVGMIRNRTFECYDENSYCILRFATDFLTAYDVATADDVHVTRKDCDNYSFLQAHRDNGSFYPRAEVKWMIEQNNEQ